MRARCAALVLSAFCIMTVSLFAQDSPENSIRSVLDRQVAAWNRGDIEGFMEG